MGSRELEDDCRPAFGPVAYCGVATVSLRDGTDDRQAQASAAVAAGPWGVGSGKALEGVRKELCRESWTRVADLNSQSLVSGPRREHDRGSWRREPKGIVHGVIEGFADPVGVHLRDQLGGRAHLAPDAGLSGAASGMLRAAVQQRPYVDPFRARGYPVLIAPGQEQQLLGDAHQPGRFLTRPVDRGREFLPAAPRPPGQLKLTGQHGEGGTQFVAGVGDQRPLPGQGSPQPGQQLVHRDRERCDFVPGPGDLHTGRIGTVGHCGNLLPEPLDGGQGGAGKPVRTDSSHPDERWLPR